MIDVHIRFCLGEIVRQVALSQSPEGQQRQVLLILGRERQECTGGVQRFYHVRAIDFLPTYGFSTVLVRVAEEELVMLDAQSASETEKFWWQSRKE